VPVLDDLEHPAYNSREGGNTLPSAPTTFRTEPDTAVTDTTTRAFAYLRVSSEGQVRTDYSDDGLSIDAQREGAEEKATGLESDLVREFSDPGRSAFVDLHTLGTTVVQRLLRNRYYVGKVIYRRGTKDEQTFDERHEPLIDPETFERVQTMLDEKRIAGERPRVRQHYLRASVYCGECGNRLTFGISTGRNGREYPYFFCIGRINCTACTRRANIRPELLEQLIERHSPRCRCRPPAWHAARRRSARS
jgi:Recombinase/Recombinase zinc beta ribbon domain